MPRKRRIYLRGEIEALIRAAVPGSELNADGSIRLDIHRHCKTCGEYTGKFVFNWHKGNCAARKQRKAYEKAMQALQNAGPDLAATALKLYDILAMQEKPND